MAYSRKKKQKANYDYRKFKMISCVSIIKEDDIFSCLINLHTVLQNRILNAFGKTVTHVQLLHLPCILTILLCCIDYRIIRINDCCTLLNANKKLESYH